MPLRPDQEPGSGLADAPELKELQALLDAAKTAGFDPSNPTFPGGSGSPGLGDRLDLPNVGITLLAGGTPYNVLWTLKAPEDASGTSVVVGGDGRLKFAAAGVYTIQFTVDIANPPAGMSLMFINIADDISSDWQISEQHAVVPGVDHEISVSGTWAFPANDPVTFTVGHDSPTDCNATIFAFAVCLGHSPI